MLYNRNVKLTAFIAVTERKVLHDGAAYITSVYVVDFSPCRFSLIAMHRFNIMQFVS